MKEGRRVGGTGAAMDADGVNGCGRSHDAGDVDEARSMMLTHIEAAISWWKEQDLCEQVAFFGELMKSWGQVDSSGTLGKGVERGVRDRTRPADPPHPRHHERPERRIAVGAEDHLHAFPRHLLDEDPLDAGIGDRRLHAL